MGLTGLAPVVTVFWVNCVLIEKGSGDDRFSSSSYCVLRETESS